ncbi:hypothetical protein Cob_v010774 [Colletotrichum orbiculare MAFF 240422]|uniref:Uncharacterized protein n=1 Tax=Colletotrichum orbiculare (strain 104-T / ATCC 96160 / CBS 514.97 / LARS 414 / MAFF 240422) TaxID=1213857 RepID=A0A484FFY6_COLOR|nr:hypothetical protein Cob_v010774 [Colletotrichum orbiculare MAFF 240422]
MEVQKSRRLRRQWFEHQDWNGTPWSGVQWRSWIRGVLNYGYSNNLKDGTPVSPKGLRRQVSPPVAVGFPSGVSEWL